jgi:hypothetical protein
MLKKQRQACGHSQLLTSGQFVQECDLCHIAVIITWAPTLLLLLCHCTCHVHNGHLGVCCMFRCQLMVVGGKQPTAAAAVGQVVQNSGSNGSTCRHEKAQ